MEDRCGKYAADNWNNVYSLQWKELDVDYMSLEYGLHFIIISIPSFFIYLLVFNLEKKSIYIVTFLKLLLKQ
jgi:hypothetical protein